MKDQSLRAAIRSGLNLEKIRSLAPETLSLDYPLLESQIKLDRYPTLPSFDFEAAKAKIDELGIKDDSVITLATVDSGYLPSVTNEIAENLKGLGFNVDISTYEENQEFFQNVISRRNYDILVYEVELGAEPDLLPYYHSSQATGTGLNLSSYRNLLVDDLLLSARGTLDEEQRVKKYESFLDYWAAGVPAIGLYRPNMTYYYNQNTRPFNNDVKLVTALDRFSDITSWAVNKTTKNKTP
jgi:ABC-type transport system substrate-binding protein